MNVRSRLLTSTGAVWLAAAAVVVIRLRFLNLPPWGDEAGFLQIGAGWHLSGHPTSLYGSYWVDRPPLLVTLYGWAQHLGGVPALRLLGALAAALTVLGVADFVRTLAGERLAGRGAAWTAVTAAALLSSPYHWSFMVDGELLAVPFVAWGIALTARAVASQGRRSVLAAVGAGVLGIGAFLTKQNFVDVFVFQAAYAAFSWATRTISLRRVLEIGAAVVVGAAVTLCCAGLWVLAHGTSLHGIWYAMYQFRLDAAARNGAHAVSFHRLGHLGVAAVLSGLLLVMLAGLVGAVAHGRRDPALWSVVVLLGYGVFSVGAGTNYWLHYLVQLTVPAAALLGLTIARGARLTAVPVIAAVMTSLAVLLLAFTPPHTAEEVVGNAIRRAAMPGDGIVTLPGRSNVNYAAHLSSPYPYLWYLPAKTLDPHARRLKALLRSDQRPTWVVAWTEIPARPAPQSIGAAVHDEYREVARICGHSVFLRSDVQRPTPTPVYRSDASTQSRCQPITRLPFPLRHLVRIGNDTNG